MNVGHQIDFTIKMQEQLSGTKDIVPYNIKSHLQINHPPRPLWRKK